MVTPFRQSAIELVRQLVKHRGHLPTTRVRIFCKETKHADFSLEVIATDVAGRRLPLRYIPAGSSLLNEPIGYVFPITCGTKSNRRYRIPRGALKLHVPKSKQVAALGMNPELMLK